MLLAYAIQIGDWSRCCLHSRELLLVLEWESAKISPVFSFFTVGMMLVDQNSAFWVS